MSMTKVTSGIIDTVDASKITGAMPAIDGSALTGIDALPAVGTSGNVLTSDGTTWASGAAPAGGTDNGPHSFFRRWNWQFPAGDAVDTLCEWDNTGNSSGDLANMDFSTQRYTPQVAGWYYVGMEVEGYAGLQGNASNFHSMYSYIRKNGNVYHERSEDDYNGYLEASRFTVLISHSCLMNLNGTSDYITASVNLNTYSGTPNKFKHSLVVFRVSDL
jgi:hypothetical protein